MFGTLTSRELADKIKEGDVQCCVAQALFKEERGEHLSLINANDQSRYSFLEKAQHLIDKLSKHDLYINHWKDKE